MERFGDERHSALQDQLACASRSCGLKGEYFDARSFNNNDLTLTRTDRVVYFDWGTAAPATGMPTDSFQIRWTGTVTPAFSETYTFYTQSDDGVRLWVNNQLVIDAWSNHTSREDSGTISLQANQAYNIRLEYYDNSSSALVMLSWSSASQGKQLVPGRALTPAP
jgi:fibro-slime domain-containing protein